jgi:hypothetical protein
MSIELCNQGSFDASEALLQKVIDPGLPMKVGGATIEHVVEIAHQAHDGLLVIRYVDEYGATTAFQFNPDIGNFADSAVDDDGQPVCIDC